MQVTEIIIKPWCTFRHEVRWGILGTPEEHCGRSYSYEPSELKHQQ